MDEPYYGRNDDNEKEEIGFYLRIPREWANKGINWFKFLCVLKVIRLLFNHSA